MMMETLAEKKAEKKLDGSLFQQLQREILSLQGLRKPAASRLPGLGLGPLERAFPDGCFPRGAVHEFISEAPEHVAATYGFITGLLGRMMKPGSKCLWIGPGQTIFPPALKLFGAAPEQFVFISPGKPKDVLWVVEESLKCRELGAVVGEIAELGLAESRRLQLAVEESRVTGFIHRFRPKSESTLACVARWKITPLVSMTEEGLPGLGDPRWLVQLVKIRGGKPGSWKFAWSGGHFRSVEETMSVSVPEIAQAG